MKTKSLNDSFSNNENLWLTTFDNSFDPFKEFVSWWKEDFRLGHHCCEILAETSNVSDVASDEVNGEEIIRAMKEIVSRDPTLYRIVTNG